MRLYGTVPGSRAAEGEGGGSLHTHKLLECERNSVVCDMIIRGDL